MPSLTVKRGQLLVAHEGYEFPLWIGENGGFFLYDPKLLLDAEHVRLPTSRRVLSRTPGLGTSTGGMIAENVIPAALSFVPVVGPILGPIASIAESLVGNMFGGNDPTPLGSLIDHVVQLRMAIVNANLSLGIQDQFPTLPAGKSYAHDDRATPVVLELWPANVNIGDINHWQCDFSGVHCSGCGHARKCLYAAINKLTPIAQQLMAQAHDAMLTRQVLSTVGQAGAAPSTLPPSASGNPLSPVQSPTDSGIPSGTFWGGGSGSDFSAGAIAPAAPSAGFSLSSMGGGALPLLFAGAALIIVATQSGRGANAPKRRRNA